MTDKSREEYLAYFNTRRHELAEVLFAPDRSSKSCVFHRRYDELFNSKAKQIVIEASRGLGKTSKAVENLAMMCGYGNFKYALIFGANEQKACERLSALKHILLTNLRFRAMFGDLHDPKRWNEGSIILANGIQVDALSWNTEVNSYLNQFMCRPDLVIADDCETEESVVTTERVDASLRKIHSKLKPAMDGLSYKIIWQQVALANYCVVRKLMQNSQWVHLHAPICDRDPFDEKAVATWADRFPMERIRSEYQDAIDCNQSFAYEREYLLRGSGERGQLFGEFTYINPEAISNLMMPKVAIIDPARTVNRDSSATTGAVLVGYHNKVIYVFEWKSEYLKPDDIIKLCLGYKDDGCEVYFEKDGLELWAKSVFAAHGMGESDIINIKAPRHLNKLDFINGLSPHFANKRIVFVGNPDKFQGLISQLRNVRGINDAANALAYAPVIMNFTPVYSDFTSNNIIDNPQSTWNKSSVGRREIYLSIYAEKDTLCATACQLVDNVFYVMDSFVYRNNFYDGLANIITHIRTAYPDKNLRAYVPKDLNNLTDYTQSPSLVVTALRQMGLNPAPSDSIANCIGRLQDAIRTPVGEGRKFMVLSHNKSIIDAIVRMYQYSGDKTLNHNVSRLLLITLETLFGSIQHNALGEIPKCVLIPIVSSRRVYG